MNNNQRERKVMNNKFDELAKGLAQSVTRRKALRRFGAGLAGIVLVSLGLANKADAQATGKCHAWRCCCGYEGRPYVAYSCGNVKPGGRCHSLGSVDCSYCNCLNCTPPYICC